MKKIALFIFNFSLLIFHSNAVRAGGLVTNSNQNVAFLRQMSQDGIIDIAGLYLNPAGTAFLKEGWHVSANWQNAKQRREITTDFPLFQQNQQQPYTPHEFEGKAYAPVLPSFQLSYNKEKWSLNANFALNGGGGKCEYDQGLGSFEALYAGQLASMVPTMLPTAVSTGLQSQMGLPAATADAIGNTAQYTGYSLDAYMKGRQYYFGLSLGATYKFKDNLAGFVGLRTIYATCNYNGYVQDITAYYTVPNYVPQGEQVLDQYGLALNCDQTGFGVTPILGIDYRINKHWNIAAKYEFETKMRLKNTSEMNNFALQQVANGNTTLAQFENGRKVAANIPGILNAGVQYSPIEKVRLMAGWHYYFDKGAKQYNDKQKQIDKNTQEFSAGAEWNFCKWVTVSASWQNTRYGLGDQYMNDLSFNVSNNMIGAGFRVHPSKRFSIDLGYMHTFYKDKTVTTATAVGLKTDTYTRKNRVFGLGVNVDF